MVRRSPDAVTSNINYVAHGKGYHTLHVVVGLLTGDLIVIGDEKAKQKKQVHSSA
jgi:hypothetical protein